MRLNKFIAASGFASRRKADELIFGGRVSVNGRIVKEPWFEVDEKRDRVEIDGQRIKIRKKKKYLKLYKPAGFETRLGEKGGDIPSLLDIPGIEIPDGVFPVGRLDVNTEGLVILTSDGDFSYIMTHPRFEIPRRYKVKVWGRVRDSDLDLMVRGVDIGNGEYGSFDAITPLRVLKGTSWYELVIHEGKYREIRRVFARLGYKVLRLIRVSFGEIWLGDMRKGEIRKFEDEELEYVRQLKDTFISRR